METKCDFNKCIINTTLHKTLNISCGGAVGSFLCVFLCFPCTLCLSCSTVPPSVHRWSPFYTLLARSDALAAHLPFISLVPTVILSAFLDSFVACSFCLFRILEMSNVFAGSVTSCWFQLFLSAFDPPPPPIVDSTAFPSHFYCLTAIIGKSTKNKHKARFFPPRPRLICFVILHLWPHTYISAFRNHTVPEEVIYIKHRKLSRSLSDCEWAA